MVWRNLGIGALLLTVAGCGANPNPAPVATNPVAAPAQPTAPVTFEPDPADLVIPVVGKPGSLPGVPGSLPAVPGAVPTNAVKPTTPAEGGPPPGKGTGNPHGDGEFTTGEFTAETSP